MFGLSSLEQIHFPPCIELPNLKQERLTSQLLNVLDRGLLIYYNGDDIFAVRKCRYVCSNFVFLTGARRRSVVVVDRRIDPSLSYCSFQPALHDWCNKGCGVCYPVCGMVHIKEPLLLIGKSSLCGGSRFSLLLSEIYCNFKLLL